MQISECLPQVLINLGCKPELRQQQQLDCISQYLRNTLSYLNINSTDCINCAKTSIKLSFHKNETIIKLKQQVEYFYIILEGQISLNYLLTCQDSNGGQVEQQNKCGEIQRQSSIDSLLKTQQLQGLSSGKADQQMRVELGKATKPSQSELVAYRILNVNDHFGERSICFNRISQNIVQCHSKHAVCLAIPKETFYSTLQSYFNYHIHNDIAFLENKVHIFKDWNINLIKRVTYFVEKIRVKRGNLIYNEGDDSNCVYFIQEGEFSAFKQYFYAPSFLIKNQLNDCDRIRADANKEIDNKRSQKALKILVLSEGEVFGENEIFAQQDSQNKRCFSVMTESQQGVLLKMHSEIFQELILSDLNTKKNILHFHKKRMTFIDEKIQNQRQQLSQYMDLFFESKPNLEMKKKSIDFLKNQLKNIDQLNKDSFNKYLQNAYKRDSPTKAKFASLSNLVSPTAAQNNHLSVPTLNYIIDHERQNDIVTESDYKQIKQTMQTEESSDYKTSISSKECKHTQILHNSAKPVRINNPKYQDLHFNNVEHQKKYWNAFFYRQLDQKQNNLEDPLMHRDKSKRQIGLEALQKKKESKASLSPSRTNISRQNSQMLTRMNEINESHPYKNSIQSSLQQSIAKQDNPLHSINHHHHHHHLQSQIQSIISHTPRINVSPSKDQDNQIAQVNSCTIRFEDQAINTIKYRERYSSEIIYPNKQEHSPPKLSPQQKNRKIVSHSTHLINHQTNLNSQNTEPIKQLLTKTNSIELQEFINPKQLLKLFKYQDSEQVVRLSQHVDTEMQRNPCKMEKNKTQTKQPIRLNSCHLRAKTQSNISSSYLNDQNLNDCQTSSLLFNHQVIKTNENSQPQASVGLAQAKIFSQPLEIEVREIDNTPLIYNSTATSTQNNKISAQNNKISSTDHKISFHNNLTTNNKAWLQSAVQKNFYDIFLNEDNKDRNNKSVKQDTKNNLMDQLSSLQFPERFNKLGLATNKQGCKLSYYKTNAFSQNSLDKRNSQTLSTASRQNMNVCQIKKSNHSPLASNNTDKKNIHVSSLSKSKNSFDVFDKILLMKQSSSASPQKNHSLFIKDTFQNQNTTIFQNQALILGISAKNQ